MVKLCTLDQVPAGSVYAVTVTAPSGPLGVLLVHDESGPVAFANVCPHQGRSLDFAPGEVLMTPQGQLVCPHHGASFDLPSGRCVAGPCEGDALRPLPIEVRDGVIWLRDSRG